MIPATYVQLKGTLQLRPPDVKKAVDVPFDLRVRDRARWRLGAAAISALLGLLLVYWSTIAKRRLLNQAARDDVTQRLAEFLAGRPALATDSSVQLIRHLIVNSRFQDRIGQFDEAQQSLADAASRVTQLVTAPPAAPTPLVQGAETIRIANPADRRAANANMMFVIGQPDPQWPASGGTFEWTLSASDGTTIAQTSGMDLRQFQHVVPRTDLYTVTVTVDGVHPAARQFSVGPPVSRTVADRFQLVQVATLFATFVLAVASAYLMTDTMSFGTVGDYVKLVGTAVGLSGGTGSAATILSALRG
jgi:hypothetical protein